MSKRFALCNAVLMLVLLLASSPLLGAVAIPIPLKRFHDGSVHVAVARVDSVDPARPALKLTVIEDLKGALPDREILINLTGYPTGDPPSRATDVTDRIAAGMMAVIFVDENKENPRNTIATLFCEGSWFRISPPDGGKAWPYQFGEFYFRRVFSGTTSELKQALAEIKAGGKGPDLNNNEKPGLGAALPGVTPSPLTIPTDPAKEKAKDKSATNAKDKVAAKDTASTDAGSKPVAPKDAKSAAKPAPKPESSGLFRIVGGIVIVAGIALLVYVFVIRKKVA